MNKTTFNMACAVTTNAGHACLALACMRLHLLHGFHCIFHCILYFLQQIIFPFVFWLLLQFTHNQLLSLASNLAFLKALSVGLLHPHMNRSNSLSFISSSLAYLQLFAISRISLTKSSTVCSPCRLLCTW